MPYPPRSGRDSDGSLEQLDEDDNNDGARRNPRRTRSKVGTSNESGYAGMDTEDDSNTSEVNPASTEEDDDEEMLDADEEEDEDIQNKSGRSRREGRKGAANGKKGAISENNSRRTSSRANKFVSSMAEPTHSIKDLLLVTEIADGPSKRRGNKQRDSDQNSSSADESDDEEEKPTKKAPQAKNRGRNPRGKKNVISPDSPHKTPARRHAKARQSMKGSRSLFVKQQQELSDESSFLATSSDESEGDEEEDDEEPIKIQRIIACRSEKVSKWKEMCKTMNTSEIEQGSRWFQDSENGDTENINADFYEERFLVKWADLGFLHCSWETQNDLVEQVETAKTSLSTFFRKSENGLLFTADERCDGDYFNPGYTQIERILEVQLPEDGPSMTLTAEKEDKYTPDDFGIIMDKSDPDYEAGTGRQFLIKWCNIPYHQSTYEFERDLILNDVEYKDNLKAFLRRNKKPNKKERKRFLEKGEAEYRRTYKIFGEKVNMSEEKREAEIKKYHESLLERVYKNGGQLRDYQTEGVSFLISNFVNRRSSILADEMGLGKTLQTAAMCEILLRKMNRGGPILIVAPLSTLAHWHREFSAWTDLNAIVYHGSQEERDVIREHEFAYETDRPQGSLGLNQLFLKKCGPNKRKGFPSLIDSPWMVDIVCTTPEMIVTEDYKELTAVQWEALIVDEAHRLKNHSSKLAVNLRDPKFSFKHKVLLTGTPIQNNVDEFWTLLNVIDEEEFDSVDDFLERYGDMKSQEQTDELHETIRPYILRRLKEDVEKSVPPKAETLIEVELTASQKQYYRALYEKNVKFLHKNKRKALDGPSLNNLAMQLRKCCNHLFLLNGVEEEFRKEEVLKAKQSGNESFSEEEFLVKGSGKLILLDKLLPRLKEEGHRVLIFSQFKIMLDILEDYLNLREMKYERIDGSITGNKRQQAIDRYQIPTPGKEPPFIMLLSTKAGGLGINLTAADTCIIFDSDWNPQNDAQAQARCHRIGQTKEVKVYRLLTRKTYEMQMFHVSSKKLGLDQAVLKGFESGAGEDALSKEEVEKLLRNGAYDIFNEEKAGTAEAESNDFIQQDIDSILSGARTVVDEKTGSKSNAGGSTFSKARFKAAKSPDGKKGNNVDADDVDVNDPDFWKKMVGEPNFDEAADDLTKKRRQRNVTNYSEKIYMKNLEAMLTSNSGSESDDSSAEEDDDATFHKRGRWGGSLSHEWTKEDAESIIERTLMFGYLGHNSLKTLLKRLRLSKEYGDQEIQRMCWSIILLTFLEVAEEDSTQMQKRQERAAEKEREKAAQANSDGGVLAEASVSKVTPEDEVILKRKCFSKLWATNISWARHALEDCVSYAKNNDPREQSTLDKVLHRSDAPKKRISNVSTLFMESVWPSLKNRGWKGEMRTEGNLAGQVVYKADEKEYTTIEAVLEAARERHPELSNAVDNCIELSKSQERESLEFAKKETMKLLSVTADTIDAGALRKLLEMHAPLQLLGDRVKKHHRLRLSRKIISTGSLLDTVSNLIQRANASEGDAEAIHRLEGFLTVGRKFTLPHPLWTSRHDAVLIHAVSKHGWIDQETSCRSIIDDSSVKWGAPFDYSGDDVEPEVSTKVINKAELMNTASRAAALLSNHADLFEELKGFNKDLIIRSCSLVRVVDKIDEPTDLSNTSKPLWTVDENGVQFLTNSNSSSQAREPVDLPPKKDLVRRARTILSRVTGLPEAAKEQPEKLPIVKHDFCALDQSDRSNVLLSEMFRGILRENFSSSKHIKKLCSLCLVESQARLKSIIAVDSDSSKPASEMKRIVQHIELLTQSLNKGSTQCKNIIRVILGDEPIQPKNPTDALFPAPKAKALEMKNGTRVNSKSSRSSTSAAKAPSKTTGSRAIESAEKRLLDRNDGVELEKKSAFLELTEVETLILHTISEYGIPSMSVNGGITGAPVTWVTLGKSVVELGRIFLEKAAAKVEMVQSAVGDPASMSVIKQNASRIEEDYYNKETALGQATDYAAEPETLAKKTIMMLEKLRRHMGSVSVTAFTARSDNGLGSKILVWIRKQLHRWASSLDLLDDSGRPLAFSAIDFLPDLSESEKDSIHVAAILDRKGCRCVISQIAMLTRNRSLLDSRPREELLLKIDKAAKTVSATGDAWGKQPEWWTADEGSPNQLSANNDALLLERLRTNGFGRVLAAKGRANLTGVLATKSFNQMGLTKAVLQQRANQLVREFHNIEESGNSFRILEERRNERASTGVELPSKVAVSKAQAGGGVQTGLHSFFAANDAVAVDGDSDEVEVIGVLPSSGEKRKEEGMADRSNATLSPEKKQRLSTH